MVKRESNFKHLPGKQWNRFKDTIDPLLIYGGLNPSMDPSHTQTQPYSTMPLFWCELRLYCRLPCMNHLGEAVIFLDI